MKVYIPADRKPYENASDFQIKGITTRIKIMARELGIETEFYHSQLAPPQAPHAFNEAVFEIARGSVEIILDPALAGAAIVSKWSVRCRALMTTFSYTHTYTREGIVRYASTGSHGSTVSDLPKGPPILELMAQRSRQNPALTGTRPIGPLPLREARRISRITLTYSAAKIQYGACLLSGNLQAIAKLATEYLRRICPPALARDATFLIRRTSIGSF